MEETILRPRTLASYKYLFPKATGIDEIIKKGANVKDTIQFMPKACKLCLWMVKDFVRVELKGLSLNDACRKLWRFGRYLIGYKHDELTKEQIKSVRRLISDGEGDCDCKTNFVNTCLTEYGIKGKIINRICAYDGAENFSHIYSLIPDGNGKYIIMDCVWEKYNEEKPYSKKEDYPMELQFLDGIEDTKPTKPGVEPKTLTSLDADLSDLGKILKHAAKKNKGPRKGSQNGAPKKKHKSFGEKLLKVGNVLNKFNLAAILLRAGMLASMKLNLFKVAEGLKWGYATPELAESKGMDMSKFGKLKKVLKKTENIFFAAGGKQKNLRASIIKGHGNRHHVVAGIDGLGETTPLETLLGEVYGDEFLNKSDGFEGFGDLGEPATGAAIAAASASMGIIAALLKSIGPLFPKAKPKEENAGTAREPTETPGGESTQPGQDPNPPVQTLNEGAEPEAPEITPTEQTPENLPAPIEENTDVVPVEAPPEEAPEAPTPAENAEEGVNGILAVPIMGIKAFYQKHTWAFPVSVAVGFIATVLIVDHFTDKPKIEIPAPAVNHYTISGTKPKKKKKKKGGNGQHLAGHESVIALM